MIPVIALVFTAGAAVAATAPLPPADLVNEAIADAQIESSPTTAPETIPERASDETTERPWAFVASGGMPGLAALGLRRQLAPGWWLGVEIGTLMGILFSSTVDLTADFSNLKQVHLYFGVTGTALWTHGCAWGGCGEPEWMGGAGPKVGFEWRSSFGLTIGGDLGVMAGHWGHGDPRKHLWMPQVTPLRVGYRPRWDPDR